MKTLNILGIKIHDTSLSEALELIEKFIESNSKYYIVTPNPEFLVAANSNPEFKKVLNNADLAIPDGVGLLLASRIRYLLSVLGFQFSDSSQPGVGQPVLQSGEQTTEKPNTENRQPKTDNYPILRNRTTGIDLMLALCKLSAEKGFTIGLIGGEENVALETKKRLEKTYKNLKVAYADSGGMVDNAGNFHENNNNLHKSDDIFNKPIDILFVAFGQIKQELWISKNLEKLNVKVAMGVGGAFDYISGKTIRAPKFIRQIGLEWLFRLILEPWRIKRQINLLKFIWMSVVQ